MLALNIYCNSWTFRSSISCRGRSFLSLNCIKVPGKIAEGSAVTSVSLTVWKDATTFLFTGPWKLKLYESSWKGWRMASLETSAIDIHLCNRGSAVASGDCRSNDSFVEASQGEASQPLKEDFIGRQTQLESSSHKSPCDKISPTGNAISLVISHADSSVELEYTGRLKKENSLKLPEGEVFIRASSEPYMTSDREHFNIDLYMNNLSTNQLGKFLIWSPRLPSTHTLLSQNFHAFPLGTTCVADTQYQGKGRSKNLWESPLGCIMFSFTLAMDNGHILPLLQYVVSLAIIEAIETVCEAKYVPSPNVRIKWPNDIYANGLKVGGVLCTSTYSSKRFNVTVGIGLNLDNENPTTCLNALLREMTSNSRLLKREEILAAFFERFEVLFDVFLKQGFSTLESKYYEKWLHSGQKVMLEERQEQNLPLNFYLTVKGLTSSGYLLATDDENNKYELHPNGNSFDFFKGLVRKKLAE